jgi:acetyl esterase/lipase
LCIGGLTDEEGASCVNINYRLAPEHKVPTGALDCWDVVQWAAQHASELGADPRKGFIIGGPSGGAHLTDIVGHLARDEKLEPPITGLVEICTGVCQAFAIPEEYKAEFLSWDQDLPGGLSTEGIDIFSRMAGGDPNHHSVSPFLWPTGHQGLPPVFFQIHGRDPLTSVYFLAYLLHQQREYTEASELYRRACDGYTLKLGPQHPTTIACNDHHASMEQEEKQRGTEYQTQDENEDEEIVQRALALSLGTEEQQECVRKKLRTLKHAGKLTHQIRNAKPIS